MLTWKNDGACAGWSIILCNLVNFRFVHKSILLVSPQAWVLFLQKWNDLLCHTGKDHLSFLLCQSDCRPHPDCFHLSPLTLCLNGLPMSGASVFCLSACAPASGHSSVQPLSWFRSHAYFEFSPVETKKKKKKISPLLWTLQLCPVSCVQAWYRHSFTMECESLNKHAVFLISSNQSDDFGGTKIPRHASDMIW